MSSNIVTIELRAEDAEPILYRAAYDAAKYGAYVDFIPRRCWNSPQFRVDDRYDFDAWRSVINKRFLAAKRIVNAFGVEHEQTSEEETLTVTYRMKNEKRTKVKVGGLLKYTRVTGGEPNYKKPEPMFRSGVHNDACEHAAQVVVKRWKTLVEK